MNLFDLWFPFVAAMEEHAEQATGSGELEEWLPALPEADGNLLLLAGFMGKYSNCGCFTDSALSWRDDHDRLAQAMRAFGYPKEASMLAIAADLEEQIRAQDDPENLPPELKKACDAMEDAVEISSEGIMGKVMEDPARYAIDARGLMKSTPTD